MTLSIGERLKSVREAKKITLEEASRATKVQRRTLEAIESNQVQNLLDPVYAKIFLRKYAAYLGLDEVALLDEYVALRGAVPEKALTSSPTATPSPTAPASSFSQKLVLAVVGIVALIGIAFVGYLAADIFGSRIKKRHAAHSAGAKHSIIPSVSVEKTPQAPKLIVPRSQPLKLMVRTKTDVWLQVKSDGSVIFQNVLRKGAQENWVAKNELELWTGNAGAMELVLNGKPLGSPGSGVRKGIRITREGLKS